MLDLDTWNVAFASSRATRLVGRLRTPWNPYQSTVALPAAAVWRRGGTECCAFILLGLVKSMHFQYSRTEFLYSYYPMFG